MRGETERRREYSARASDFNPLPSCEGRPAQQVIGNPTFYFNPLPSCEGRQSKTPIVTCDNYFNPLPSCEGRHSHAYRRRETLPISIHSPHARGDPCGRVYAPLIGISIHSPHARGDAQPNLGGAQTWYFNPLPSCEGRQHKPLKILLDSRQSIQQKHHSSFF